MPLADVLLRRFQDLAVRHGSVRLLNAYRGIPVLHPAAVRLVRQGFVTLDVHPHQVICMLLERKTHLLGDGFPQALQAGVVSVDALHSQVVLAEFCQAQASIGKRLTVRVQPVQPLDAQIFDGKRLIACQLTDISSSGVGVTALTAHVTGGFLLRLDQQVFLDVKLPGQASMLRLQAKITNLAESQDPLLQRLGMSLSPGKPAPKTLTDYIAARQAETLEELQRVHESLCRKQGSV